MIELTQQEAYAVAEFIEMNLITSIRNDPDCDNVDWLRQMIHAYEKLKELGGYHGLYDTGDENNGE